MEKVIEIKSDYFLRYRAEVPADQIEAHEVYSRDCRCNPDVTFDEKEGWHNLVHHRLEN